MGIDGVIILAAENGGAGGEGLGDWVTFGAQILNFLVLVGLLWYFLFGRVTRAMDEREEKIESRFDEADERREQAEAERDSLRDERDELERKKDRLLEDAKEEARKRREEMVEAAREEVDRVSEQWREDLRRQQETFVDEVREVVCREVCGGVRRALDDLAGADLQDRIAATLARRLGEVAGQERNAFADAAEEAGGTVTVVVAAHLSDKARGRLADAVGEHLGDYELTCETDDDLACGVVLRAGGRRIAWTAESYVRELQERLTDTLGRHATETETVTEKQREQEQKQEREQESDPENA